MATTRRPTNRPTRTGPAAPITPRQQRALHAQRRALGLDDDTWRTRLGRFRRATDPGPDGAPAIGQPCTSSAHLSRHQARVLITQMGIAGAPVARPYSGSRRTAEATVAEGGTALPTPAQTALIGRLVAEVTWREGYQAWLASSRSPTAGQPVQTYQDAEAVIEALHAMRDRQGGGARHA